MDGSYWCLLLKSYKKKDSSKQIELKGLTFFSMFNNLKFCFLSQIKLVHLNLLMFAKGKLKVSVQ